MQVPRGLASSIYTQITDEDSTAPVRIDVELLAESSYPNIIERASADVRTREEWDLFKQQHLHRIWAKGNEMERASKELLTRGG